MFVKMGLARGLYRMSIEWLGLTGIGSACGLGKGKRSTRSGSNMPLRRLTSRTDSALKLSSYCSIEFRLFLYFLLFSFLELKVSLDSSLPVGAFSSTERLYWSRKSISCLSERSSRTNRARLVLTRNKLRMSSYDSKRPLILLLSLWVRSELHRYLQ